MNFISTEAIPYTKHPLLRYYKVVPEAFDPVWGTAHAACFDLKACLLPNEKLTIYNSNNEKLVAAIPEDQIIYIMPGSRVMVPTHLIFDIPFGYSVRLHSRSGLAIKQGLVLANHEGVIDSDYVDPTMIVLTNISNVAVKISHGDRIAQGEMMEDIQYNVMQMEFLPKKKSDRDGGFGSTGVK